MSAIFISHSSSDNTLAAEVARRLAERNHPSVFLDFDPEKGIVGGQSWERTLYRKLRACRAVIALCTDAYLRSHWCFAEIALARMEGKPILALQVLPLEAAAQMPSILTEKQFIDLRRDADEGWRRFWRALDELDLAGVAGEWDPKQPPYLGLSAYQEEHAPVFFGREDEALAGVELLERGAPGLILVLGASGSGKSSLVRAGMLPRLRAERERWIIVDPFRPGREPGAELIESLARAYARYARDHVAESGGLERLRAQLREKWEPAAGAEGAGRDPPTPSASPADEHAILSTPLDAPRRDERLQRLVELLERLRDDPPASLSERLRNHLAWSLEDLLRLCGAGVTAPAAPFSGAGSASPLVDIAEHLRRVAGQRDARVLIVVDQFEELLGHAPASDSAAGFLAKLRGAIEAERSPVTVLATMRSDFMAPFQRHAALQGTDFESLSLGPMRVDGMQRVIQMPARLAALEIDEGLTERLLADTETPDALPLLSFTLWVMYRDRRDASRLELEEYERLGGLTGTISREADAVRAAAAREQREDDLRVALLQLARLTEDGSYARKPADWDQSEIARARDILEQLVERRVLVSRLEGDVPVVEVAHEALFRAWRPLQTWLDNARAELLLRQQLERDAAAWRDSRGAPDLLWRGGRLLQARELLGRRVRGSADLPAEFVHAGMQRRRRLQLSLAGLAAAVFLVLAGFLAYALHQAEQARREEARALDLARVAVGGEWLLRDPTLGALVLLEVEDAARTRFLPGKLSDALVRGFAAAEYRDAGRVYGIAIAADGTRVITVSGSQARIWEARSGRLLYTLDHPETVLSASFDPTGRFVVVRSGKIDESQYFAGDAAGERAWVWEVGASQPRFEARHQAALTLALFGPDGRSLATASHDGIVHLWDVEQGQPRHGPLRHPDKVESAAFSPDGVLLATTSGAVRLWSVDSGEPVAPPWAHEGSAAAVAFSPDGQLVAVAGSNGMRLWEVPSGRIRHSLNGGPFRSLAFSPDGLLLAAGSSYQAQVWGVEGGGPLLKEAIAQQALQSVSFAADGSILVTVTGHATRRAGVSGGNVVRYWDARNGQERYVRTVGQGPEALTIAVDRRGRYAAVNYGETIGAGSRWPKFEPLATAKLWNVATDDIRRVRLLSHDASLVAVSFSPVGPRVLTASGPVVRLWDPLMPEPVHELRHDGTVTTAAYSTDGALVVSGSGDGTARVWDAHSGALRFIARHPGSVDQAWLVAGGALLATHSDGRLRLWRLAAGDAAGSAAPAFEQAGLGGTPDTIALSPDGRLLAYRSEKTVQVWDVNQRRRLHTLEHQDWVRMAAFAGDGRFLVTGGDEPIVRIWDAQSGDERAVLEHRTRLVKTALSVDGRTVLTLAEDGTARLWDAETGRPRHGPLEHGCGARHAGFAAQGRLVVTRSEHSGPDCDAKVTLWDVDTGEPRSVISPGDAEDVAFSRDGRLMAGVQHRSGWDEEWRNAESKIRIWDTDTGQLRFADAFESREHVRAAEFSVDGSLLLAVAGNEVSVWVVSGERLQALIAGATTVCLKPDFRRQALNETEAVARAKYEACERRHGRP